MDDKIDALKTVLDECYKLIDSKITTLSVLEECENNILGKNGSITKLLKGIKDVDPQFRKEYGQTINKAKIKINHSFEQIRESLERESLLKPVSFDVTRPGKKSIEANNVGSIHPILNVMDELNQAFLSLGFEIYEGPEVSSELYSFDSLNFPPDHPARESMDTYWIAGTDEKRGQDRLCLRPHLTGGSVRYMQTKKPPFRFVYPGRVYRNESTDASHERAFFQYEALIVDKEIPFSSGKLLVETILSKVFGRKVTTRMRAGFFPFVEPGFEIDMQCLVCDGKGCSVCGQVGWIEMMPGGPPHPNVLKAANIDSNEWQGFYINVGLDRITMMKHQIDDVRLFHSGDLRFLSQFS